MCLIIIFYSKGPDYTWNRPYDPWETDRMIEEYPYIDENTGKDIKKFLFMLRALETAKQEKSGVGKCRRPESIGNVPRIN